MSFRVTTLQALWNCPTFPPTFCGTPPRVAVGYPRQAYCDTTMRLNTGVAWKQKLTINSFDENFLTFRWQLANLLTFSVFPAKWSPWSLSELSTRWKGKPQKCGSRSGLRKNIVASLAQDWRQYRQAVQCAAAISQRMAPDIIWHASLSGPWVHQWGCSR